MKQWITSKALSVGLAVIVLVSAGTWAYMLSRQEASRFQPKLPASATPTPTPQPTSVAYAVTQAVTGLNVPWSLVFTSPSRWLVTERPGTIRVIADGKLVAAPLARFDQVTSLGESGAMGMVMDPQYAKNKLLYACYTVLSGSDLTDRVVRFEDRGTAIGPLAVVIDKLPAAQNHAGCQLSFGPVDQKLYITTGDAMNPASAQKLAALSGKILRVNADGSLPADNPFPGSPVWSLGHRNSQGLAWQPDTGQLFATEHGPSGTDGAPGGDEINRILKGANYGWPVISHAQTDPRFVTPLLVYTPAVAPSGATFYTSGVLPQFTGNLFFAGLKGEGLYRVVFDKADPSKIVTNEKLADVNIGRVRDVVQGPDGALYLLTSNRDGRGTARPGDDAIYRLGPAAK